MTRYDESEGPTMADNGDNESLVIGREEDISNGRKESGWTNPLGWTDDGTDDEFVVNMEFKSLDEKPKINDNDYKLDDDILDSMVSEKDAKLNVQKHKKRFDDEAKAQSEKWEKLQKEKESKK